MTTRMDPTSSADRARVAADANEVARESRLGPKAPHLTADSDRAALIAWLGWNDPNGDYDDPSVWHEGPDGLLDRGWYVDACGENRSWFADTAMGEADARAYAAERMDSLEDLWRTLDEVLEDC